MQGWEVARERENGPEDIFVHSMCESKPKPSTHILAQNLGFRQSVLAPSAPGTRVALKQLGDGARTASGVTPGSLSSIYRAKATVQSEADKRRTADVSLMLDYFAEFVLQNQSSAAGIWTAVPNDDGTQHIRLRLFCKREQNMVCETYDFPTTHHGAILENSPYHLLSSVNVKKTTRVLGPVKAVASEDSSQDD